MKKLTQFYRETDMGVMVVSVESSEDVLSITDAQGVEWTRAPKLPWYRRLWNYLFGEAL